MQEQPGQEDGVKGSPPSVIGFGKKKEGDEEVRMLLKMIIQSQDDLKDKIHDISGQNEYLEREPLQVGNIEEFNSAISELRGAFRCLDNNWRSHKTELLDALRIVQQIQYGSWKSATSEDLEEDVVSLAAAVQHLANIVSAFKDDPDALWIVTSLFQLVSEIQYTIAFYLLEISDRDNPKSSSLSTKIFQKKRSQTLDKERIRKIFGDVEVQVSSSESCVYKVIVLETVSNLLTMLTNHTQNALQAVGVAGKGLVKTILMRKLDQELVTGVTKCITAGFEVYKHFSAEKQFRITSQLSCATEIDYSQLLKVSRSMKANEGNWILLVKYISNLATVAFSTLEKIGNCSGDESPTAVESQIVLLEAAIRGDGNVLGISQLLKKATKNRTPLKLSSVGGPVLTALYDAESLSDVLRQVLMEALGELLESVERLPDITATLEILKNPRSLPRIPAASEEEKAKAGSVLRSLQITLGELNSWNKIFLKCIKKTRKHISGALHVVEALEKYLSLFKISDNAARKQLEISSQQSQTPSKSRSGIEAKAITLTMKLANEALARTSAGRNISEAIDRVFLFVSSSKEILSQAIQHLETLENFKLFTEDSHSKSNLFLTQFQDYLAYSRDGTSEGKSWMSGVVSSITRSSNNPKEFPSDKIITDAFRELSNFKNSFEGEQVVIWKINSCTAALQFVIEASLQVEEFFDSCHQLPFPELQESLNADHGSRLDSLIGVIRETMGELVTGIGKDLGWCKPLSDAWQVCSSTNAMAAIRQALPYLIGPGKFPERVEEASLVTLLDFELRAHQILQSLMGSPSPNPNIISELNRIIDEIRVLVSQAKACSTHSNVKRLLKQDKYREKVKHSIRETWQVIEGDIVLTHAEAFNNQECLRVKVDQEKEQNSLSEKTGLIDIVHLAMGKNPVVERIEVTQDACREVLTGQGGVSGMAKGLMTQLAYLKTQLEISVDIITDIVTQEDRRTGNEYLWEIVTENEDLMENLQRTKELDGYKPLPRSYTSLTAGLNVGADSKPCETCGACRCPSCGIVSHRQDAPTPPPRRVPYHAFDNNDRQRALYDRSLSSANNTLERRNGTMQRSNSSSNGGEGRAGPPARPSSANSTRRGGRDADPSQPPLPEIYLGNFGESENAAVPTSPTNSRRHRQQSSSRRPTDRNR